jgi:DNA-binding winged helix-turn-helix (wHTH) protein
MLSGPAVPTVDHDQSAWTQKGPNRGEQGRIFRAVRSLNTDKVSFERPTEAVGAAPTEVSFGPFRLFPTQFLLLEGDKPVPVGSRALEILIVLVDRAGELVSKQELMAHVWPNLFVEPANLTVHMSRLRRMLRDGQDGNRFIINIPGRGYSFVGPVGVPGPNTVGNGPGNSAYLPRTAPSASRD